jgi:hypothetical protein
VKCFQALALTALTLVATSTARAADAQYISQCVNAAMQQAQAAGAYSDYGMATNSFSLLGGWISTGRELQYSMTLEAGTSYLFVGAGDEDVADLDLSVNDGETAVADTEDDNTPWVHLEAQETCEVTITLTNFKGSGQPDFCIFIILQSQGGEGKVKNLNAAAQGLVQIVTALDNQWSTDLAADASGFCLVGGLFGAEGELGISREFKKGSYMIVGWGDGKAQDLDAFVQDEEGETIAEDTDTDSTPVVTFESTGGRGSLHLRMHAAKGNAFGLMMVLKQKK